MASSGLIWEALAMGEAELVKTVDLSAFNWHATHPKFGSPLHAVLFGNIKALREDAEHDLKAMDREWGYRHIFTGSASDEKSRLALLRFALDKGANPTAVGEGPCAFPLNRSLICDDSSVEGQIKVFDFSGKSPGECLLAVKRNAMKQMGPDKATKDVIKTIDEALRILCSTEGPEGRTCKRVVPACFVNAWESFASDTASHDFTFLMQGASDATQETLTAHSGMLCAASPVLKAMLSTTSMTEGSRKRIELKDASRTVVELFLHIIHTGQVRVGQAMGILLGTLELAHRWQALHVVEVVVDAVQKGINIDHVVEILDVALRLQLEGLKAQSCAFASRNAEGVRQLLDSNGIVKSSAVRAELERLVIKKRRTKR